MLSNFTKLSNLLHKTFKNSSRTNQDFFLILRNLNTKISRTQKHYISFNSNLHHSSPSPTPSIHIIINFITFLSKHSINSFRLVLISACTPKKIFKNHFARSVVKHHISSKNSSICRSAKQYRLLMMFLM